MANFGFADLECTVMTSAENMSVFIKVIECILKLTSNIHWVNDLKISKTVANVN